MPKYAIRIEETVSKIFAVEADSELEAIQIAEDNYYGVHFVLEPGDLIDVKFSLDNQAANPEICESSISY